MNHDDLPEEMEQLFLDAFNGGPGSPEERRLQDFLKEHPQWMETWGEYLALRRGLHQLRDESEPSPGVRMKILQSARQNLRKAGPQRMPWHWLFSRPVAAVATLILLIGIGIYSHYGLKEFRETREPTLDREAPEGSPRFQTQSAEPPMEAAPAMKKTSPLPPPPKPAPDLTHEAPPPPAPAPPSPPSKALIPAPSGAAGAPLAQSDVSVESDYQDLLARAKRDIEKGNCPAALKLLMEARSMRDSEELRDLIARCKNPK